MTAAAAAASSSTPGVIVLRIITTQAGPIMYNLEDNTTPRTGKGLRKAREEDTWGRHLGKEALLLLLLLVRATV